MGNLEQELTRLLNIFSAENESNTADFILAQYLLTCLAAFNNATNQRSVWLYGDSQRVSESPVPR